MTGERRALVVQHRFPEHDRERGSLRVLELIDGLRADGWHVTFCSTSPAASPRYERELVRRGVPSHVGWAPPSERWVREGGFELAIVAFWHVAELVLDDLRRWSPATTIVVDSIDLHFVREARRRSAGAAHRGAAAFDGEFGDLVARELEVYRRADAVLCVSETERQLLDQVLGTSVARTVPLGEDVTPSTFPLDERRGILFVGNFRHLPNTEALEWLCREVVARLDPALLERHPLRVVGHAVDDEIRRLCDGLPGIELVGWVPSVEPELHRARVAVVPLLHGAGVKGKTLQALMAGTPVVSTPIGVEGIDVTDDRSVLVRRAPREFADAVAALLSDDDRWTAMADEGRRAVAAHHRSVTARRLSTVLAELHDSASATPAATWDDRWARHRDEIAAAVDGAAGPLDRVLLVANRDDALLEQVRRGGRPVAHLPGGDPSDGAPNPADGASALDTTAVALDRLGDPRAGVLVALASFNYWWLHLYPEWAEWLRSGRGLVHETEGCRIYRPDPTMARVGTVVTAPTELAAATDPGLAAPPDRAVAGPPPAISVVIATYNRAPLLDRCLASLAAQTLDDHLVEVVVVDDGSDDDTPEVLGRWERHLRLVHRRIAHAGRSAAKNAGILDAHGEVILLLDDDDEATPDLCARHLAAHEHHPADGDVVLGHTRWAPDLEVTAFMRHVTEVGQQLFAYPSVPTDTPLDWRHFWEGRLSLKAALVRRAIDRGVGLHDPSLAYTIDIEWAYRLRQVADLAVHYEPAAVNQMTRPVAVEDFCTRARAKGRAQWAMAHLHPDDEMRAYCHLDALAAWPELAATIDADRHEIAALESRLAEVGSLDEESWECLHGRYRRLILAHTVWGLAEARAETEGRPRASVVIPVWSVTPELAEVAAATVERLRVVSEPDLEVIVVDNGSPHGPPPPGDVLVRNPHNLGVGPAWNQGIRVARGDVVIVMNSDCTVEPGWDRALRHAAEDGRRIAFPWTDHGDGAGFRRPDQAGTAGWCFAMRRDLFDELGPFDTGFAPAFFEDTDYWHRAWTADVALSPVPAARVHHSRRTTARHLDDVDATFERNRRRYEAKHGVGFDAPPPFYARPVADHPPSARVRLAVLDGSPEPDAAALDPDDPARPRVFGIGLSKTGTSSLHAALAHLGFRSVHHGEARFRDAVRAAMEHGAAPLGNVDPTLDAFCDVPAIVERFDLVDRAYPGSRFVLTVRDLDDLVASHLRHAARNRVLREAGEAHGSLLEVDPDELRHRARTHRAAVEAHFADCPHQLLVLDICGGEGWEPLAPFLGWNRLPERTFPWENAADAEPESHTTDVGSARVAVP